MAELLKVDNLSAGYGEAVVLNNISLVLGEGKTLALLGRNGTGSASVWPSASDSDTLLRTTASP